MGRSFSKETVLSTWVERYVGLAVPQSQKVKIFGVWLGNWRGYSVKTVKVSSYKAQYPILRIAHSALHFTSLFCRQLAATDRAVWLVASTPCCAR